MSEQLDAIEQLAVLGKAFGDQLRLQILRILSTESLGVLELSHVFDMRQPAMSHHLKVLYQAGLVTTRKEGNTVFYRRSLPPSDEVQESVVKALFVSVDRQPLADKFRVRLEDIQKQRAEQSRAFFARHADAFRQHQELITDPEPYACCAADVIDKTIFPDKELAMELGPGEGAFLTTLSQRFQQVYAVDNCGEMLEKSQMTAASNGLDNIEFILGEIDQLGAMTNQFDCIVANMVLHHVASPTSIFSGAARLLKRGGSLLISELSQHDQAWVKDSCGDLWLGFSPEELSQWAKDAGLVSGESQYLGLRNGFQIQVRRFIRPGQYPSLESNLA
ncbi:metalloregulator ArsR/SmtB family transcription factor [Endozoicomonas sp. Mp262]|uniref:ArsR/SmtB family transcription factor n=1 Tax=Endozoicomonas sp. Mp262 TaxID=2919499 RepID=UPI0021D95945